MIYNLFDQSMYSKVPKKKMNNMTYSKMPKI